MPTLNWIGKDKVVNHAAAVPFYVLEHKYNFGGASENKIIHGDNLLALKSLLPEYEGRVKCIYIDPPYNTGNENWIYNDNVNSPQIKKWLGQVVGKEGEDLSRHDKWLCMMYPRLKLLKKLLADDGAIFISIDDNEQANLKLLCDEIFGSWNFIAQFTWRRRSGANDALNNVSLDHEYLTCYAKDATRFTLNGIEKDFVNYSNPDNDPRGDWTRGDLSCGKTAAQRPNLFYPIIDPTTGITYECNSDHVWRFERNRMQELIAAGKILFPPDNNGRPAYKRHRNELRSTTKPFSSIIDTKLNTMATRELREIFGSQVFDYPKTVNLIQQLIAQATNSNSIVLDSFAGSGTTAHAVLNLNTADGGNRKFILVEMEDYADTITAERVRRVIQGYGQTEGTGGNFDFYEVGEPLMIQDNLNENINIETIRAYIWYTETHTQYKKPSGNNSGYLGNFNGTAIYFHYERNRKTILDTKFLRSIEQKADSYLIYADECILTKIFLPEIPLSSRKFLATLKSFGVTICDFKRLSSSSHKKFGRLSPIA